MNRSATRTFLGVAMVALAAAGCSSSEADSSSDAASATQFFLDFADAVGVELDQSCVKNAVETLSPEDTKTLAEAPDASMELIASAPFNDAINAVGARIFDDCFTRALDE